MSHLEWIITRSDLPPKLKEVLYELIENFDDAIDTSLEEADDGFKSRLDNIELALNDESKIDDLICVADLKEEFEELRDKVLEEEEEEESTEPEEEIKKVEVKDGQILKEITCPYCGGKIEIE